VAKLLYQVKSVLAFYFGDKMNIGVVSIATDHVKVNSGFSMPRFAGWLVNSQSVMTSLVTLNVNERKPTATFVVFCSQYDARHAPSDVDTCELFIFRRGCSGNSLVNL
jgi:hypothetical protein